MSMQNISFDHQEAPRPWSSELPRNPPKTPHDSESTLRSQQQSSSTTQPNHSTPDSLSPQTSGGNHQHRFSSTTHTTSSGEVYGPQRHRMFSRPFANLGRHVLKPSPPPDPRLGAPQMSMFAGGAPMAGLKDELTLAAGKVTPGVDDTPYIQYALQMLTRDRKSPMPQDRNSPHSADEYMTQLVRAQTVREAKRGYSAIPQPQTAFVGTADFHDNQQRMASRHAHSQSLPSSFSAPAVNRIPPNHNPSSEHWVAITDDMRQSLDPRGRTYPPLTYKPRILRPFSMMILMVLCLLFMAALVYTTQYAARHDGLVEYTGTVYSSQYFIFRILPQILGCVILLYAQSIVNTSLRILPFVALANEDPRSRYMALFQRLYPTTLLAPQFSGPWQLIIFDVATWLTMFTIPLLSSTFTCVYVDKTWRWNPVDPVVWATIGIYGLLVIATGVLMVFWFGKWTGLLWDMRSIADLLPLLNCSNSLGSFDYSDLPAKPDDLKMQLRDRWFDRLGYWRTGDLINGGTWYTIGAVGARGEDQRTAARVRASFERPSFESEDIKANMAMRANYGRYLPFCLRNMVLYSSALVSALIVLGILLAAFLPQTRLDKGFNPLLRARPTDDAFSAANFLYSFVPAFIGMVFFMLFQSVDQALRRVQPWGDLMHVSGSPARKSLLADYAACHPFQSALSAARNGNLRLAFISLMTQLFAFIPILAGGLLIALTDADGQVRMYANIPVFGVLVALMLIYAGCFVVLIPRRGQFELPRPVETLAALMSLCSARELVRDPAFRAVRCRQDLKMRLGADSSSNPKSESVWFYGVVPGKDEHRVSVRRMQRYTAKPVMRTIEAMV